MAHGFIITHANPHWHHPDTFYKAVLQRISDTDPDEIFAVNSHREALGIGTPVWDEQHNGRIPRNDREQVLAYDELTITGGAHGVCVEKTVQSLANDLIHHDQSYQFHLPFDCITYGDKTMDEAVRNNEYTVEDVVSPYDVALIDSATDPRYPPRIRRELDRSPLEVVFHVTPPHAPHYTPPAETPFSR